MFRAGSVVDFELVTIAVSCSWRTTRVPIEIVEMRPPARKATRIRSGFGVWKASASTTTSVGQNAERIASQTSSGIARV